MNNETVREVCAEYTQPNHTCRNCEFAVCPVIDVFAGKVLAAHEREVAAKDAVHLQWRKNYHDQLAAKDAEIARLKEALKPVMECRVVGWKIEDGDELPRLDLLANCHNAVRESQRIVGAWDDKNYFDKENNNAKL